MNVVAGSGSSAMVKGASDEDDEGAFDVSKIKGKLAKRPPKGVGNAKKEKAGKDKKANDPKKSKKASLISTSLNPTIPPPVWLARLKFG